MSASWQALWSRAGRPSSIPAPPNLHYLGTLEVLVLERDVRIEVDSNGHGKVVVDGVDIRRSVTGVTIDASASQTPQVAVFLRFPNIVLDGKLHPNPRLDESERNALVALGWTPPADKS